MRTVIISCFCGHGEKLIEDDGRLKHSERHILVPCEKHHGTWVYEVMARLLDPPIEYNMSEATV